jgi:radical SAM protein with 4Fe4S-binding SPASM domain
MTPSSTIRTTMPEHFLKSELGKKHYPISFDYDLTARCNNDCNHCYINVPPDNSEYQKRELSLNQIENIADEAVSMGTMWCQLSGGEPLIREDFEDIYLLLKRKGLLLSLLTNATLITHRHIDFFKKYPPRDIEITVYGVTKETFGKVTNRPENFKAFMRGLNLLLENNIPVRLKTMIMRSNIHEFSEIAAFCRKHTKDFFRFDPHLHLRYDRDQERNHRILAERLSPEEIAAVDHKDPSRSASLIKDCRIYIRDSVKSRSHERLFICGLGRHSFSLSFDGMFRLCSSLCAPMCMYDLKNGSLVEAWTKFTPRVLSMTASDPETMLQCNQCQIFNLCLWCPANAYLEFGKLEYRSDYFCDVARARAEALKSQLESNPE